MQIVFIVLQLSSSLDLSMYDAIELMSYEGPDPPVLGTVLPHHTCLYSANRAVAVSPGPQGDSRPPSASAAPQTPSFSREIKLSTLKLLWLLVYDD